MNTGFRRGAALLAGGLALQFAAAAQAQVYRCTDANGGKLYTDMKKGNCELIESAPVAPRPPAASPLIPAVRPGNPAAAASGTGGGTTAATPSPSNFPRVDTSQQRVRDDDRRAILNEELRAEEKKLAELKAVFKNGEPDRQGNERNYAKYLERVGQMRDDINRTERNIEALRREIANVR
ncbi:DUF4124 domain-containing protein [Massilia niabensis]|uniref:DUF4124 domain-containing protein n=1 Tax=Massilia niabensis TaxID=544910 RepID=A0ABW0KZ36_9BURK